MTPGQEALIEAMRLEQARIYGTLCPEHHNPMEDLSLGQRIYNAVNAGWTNSRIMTELPAAGYEQIQEARKLAMKRLVA